MQSLGNLQLDTSWVKDNKEAAALIGGAAGLAALTYLYKRSGSKTYKKTPTSFEISGGAVDADKVKDTVRAARSCLLRLTICLDRQLSSAPL